MSLRKDRENCTLYSVLTCGVRRQEWSEIGIARSVKILEAGGLYKKQTFLLESDSPELEKDSRGQRRRMLFPNVLPKYRTVA